jgi:hypothetical protein
MSQHQLARLLLLTMTAAAGVAGCNSDNDNDNGSTAISLSDFVTSRISSQTCGNTQSEEVNGIDFTTDEVPIDVDAVIPGASNCPRS